ncbi:hypothetical protein IWQ62_003705 [Dispira parvispora]|uniref:RING-type domain-containing protein n=1 Tax=Dispira parvispora TaxID=1520584 RepID=A0A9W8ATP2_9FUNG|nr:hypothetical protein IWQ62_003705 [Dispira parvispora]
MTFERQYSDPTPLQRAQTCRSWHERVALRASANIFRPHSLNIESSSVAPLTATTIAVSPTDHNWSGDSSSCPQSYYNASKDELGVSEQSQLEVISTRPRGTNIQVPSTLSPSPLKPTPTRPPSLLDSLRKLPPLKLPQSGKLDEQASLPNLCHSEHLGRSRPGKPASLFQPDRYSVGTWRSLRSLRSIRSLKIIPFLTGWEAINDQEDFPESSITSNSVVPVESTPGAFQPQRSRLRDNESSDIQTPAKLMEPVQLNQPNDCASPPVTDDVDTPLCAICFESFASGDTIRRLFCAHIYHVDCIDPWLLRVASTCPLCKRSCAAPLPVPHIEDESTEPVSRVHSALPQTNALATTGGQNSGFDHTSL